MTTTYTYHDTLLREYCLVRAIICINFLKHLHSYNHYLRYINVNYIVMTQIDLHIIIYVIRSDLLVTFSLTRILPILTFMHAKHGLHTPPRVTKADSSAAKASVFRLSI